MAFIVTDVARIEQLTTMIQQILLMSKHIYSTWTAESMLAELQNHLGLKDITLSDLNAVKDNLINDGILEEI